MQTLGGAYVDDFGAGLYQVSISGITGYKARYNSEGMYVDGYEEFVNFRKNIYRDFVESNDPNRVLIWYNWEDREYFKIQPTIFRLQRSISEPTLYRYEFNFTCIGKATSGRASSNYAVYDFASIGNRVKASTNNISEVLIKLRG
jgi:hypothetical protein